MKGNDTQVMHSRDIVLLDDDADMRDLLEVAFASEGFRVWSHSDARSVREAFQRAPSAVLIADIHLEGADGVDVCRAVHREFPEAALVVLSGDASQQGAAMQSGVHSFFTKPVNLHDLMAEVRELTRSVAQEMAQEKRV